MRVEESLFIPRSPAVVFRYAARPENMPAWNAAILESRVLGALAVGASVIQRIRVLGKPIEMLFEIIAFDPPRLISCQSRVGPIQLAAAMEFRRMSGGTQVRWVVDGESRGFLHAADSLIQQAGRVQMRLSLENLQNLILGAPSSAPGRGGTRLSRAAGTTARSAPGDERVVRLPRSPITVSKSLAAAAGRADRTEPTQGRNRDRPS